jgi:mono/diheme cytochrome c family protein
LKSLTEAGLALLLVLVLGGSFWWFAGGPADDGGTAAPTIPTELDPEAVARGMALATETACAACHSADGTTLTGPTWKGVAGSSRPLETGESVIADTAYLTSSITDPGAQIVAGFTNVMPADYADQLTDTEIADLVAYIQSLAG